MGFFLKSAGVLFALYQAFGDKVTSTISENYDFAFDRLRRGDVKFDIRNGKAVGLLAIRFKFRQTFGVNLTFTGMKLNFQQQGTLLGVLDYQELIALPNAEMVEFPLTLKVPIGPFFRRLEVLTTPGTDASALAPLEISGKLYLSNGVAVPIRKSINFLSY